MGHEARGVALVAGLGLLGLVGCPAAQETCTTQADCGEGGVCESSGYCSFADDGCASGRRYGDDGPRANTCVESTGTTTGAVPPGPEDSSGTGGEESLGAGEEVSGESTAAEDECTVITIEESLLSFGDGRYTRVVMPMLGDQVLEDEFTLQFNTHVVGTFELGVSDWGSLVSCPHCITVVEDFDRTYFAVEGELTVATGSTPLDGRFQANLSGVRLQEAEIDPDTSSTVIQEDGDCLILEDTNINALVVPGWNCGSGDYEDTFCDCGCGLPDPACVDQTAASCEVCELAGSCSFGQGSCPGAIDPNDNSVCDLSLWTCNPDAYDAGDGICDCGCGLIDPDCDGSTIEACTVCSNPGSCTMGNECVGYIAVFNNGQCGENPGWTCPDQFYGGGDGLCDCGCGIPDPDCEEPTIQECAVCNELGSCTEEPCPATGELNPDDPSQCLP